MSAVFSGYTTSSSIKFTPKTVTKCSSTQHRPSLKLPYLSIDKRTYDRTGYCHGGDTIGSLRRGVFEWRVTTGSGAFSLLLICIDATNCSLPRSRFLDVTQRSPNASFGGALRDIQETAARETILTVKCFHSYSDSAKPQPKTAKSPLSFDVCPSKTPLIKLPVINLKTSLRL